MKGEGFESRKSNKNSHNSQKVVQAVSNTSYSEMVLLAKAQALNAYLLLIVLT